MNDFARIENLLADTRAATAECRNKDKIEYDSAVAALEGCGEKRMISAAEAAERLDYPMKMIDFIVKATNNYYREGFAAPDELDQKAEQWEQLSKQVDALKERAGKLTVDSWQGDGSAGYRAKIPVFCEDLTNIAKLSSGTASNSGLARADIQGTNDRYEMAMKKTFDTILPISKISPKTDWPAAAWWKKWNADWSNQEQYQFTFFTRCAQAGEALLETAKQLCNWIQTYQPDTEAAKRVEQEVSKMGGKVRANGLAVGVTVAPGAAPARS